MILDFSNTKTSRAAIDKIVIKKTISFKILHHTVFLMKIFKSKTYADFIDNIYLFDTFCTKMSSNKQIRKASIALISKDLRAA